MALALTFLPPSWGKNDPTASDPIDSVAGYEGRESWQEIAQPQIGPHDLRILTVKSVGSR